MKSWRVEIHRSNGWCFPQINDLCSLRTPDFKTFLTSTNNFSQITELANSRRFQRSTVHTPPTTNDCDQLQNLGLWGFSLQLTSKLMNNRTSNWRRAEIYGPHVPDNWWSRFTRNLGLWGNLYPVLQQLISPRVPNCWTTRGSNGSHSPSDLQCRFTLGLRSFGAFASLTTTT